MGPHTRIVATDVRSEVVQLAKALVGEMRGFSAQGRAPVQRVLSTAAGAKRVSAGAPRWGNLGA
jgi:hypothetical protein